jgi:Tol biopolymer transport system component
VQSTSWAQRWRNRLAVLAALPLLSALFVGLAAQAPAHASVSAGDVVFEYDHGSSVDVAQLSGDTLADLGAGAEPDVSPDGSQIAFIGTVGSNQALEVMNSGGSDVTQVDFPTTDDGSDTIVDWFPRWSPNGQWIVFIKEETYEWSYNWQVFKVKPNGSDLTQLTDDTDYATNAFASWSPDGSQIVYTHDSSGDGYYRLYIMNADGSSAHEVDSSSGANQLAPDWSPDGSRIPLCQAVVRHPPLSNH